MIEFYLFAENISTEFLKIYNFYFQNILFDHLKEVKQNDKNLIYIKKELYAIQNFEKKLIKIIKNKTISYLSKCKNIIFLPANSYKIIDNKITFNDKNIETEIIFENTKYSPISNAKYERFDLELAKIYANFKKNEFIIYNKNIPIKFINEIIIKMNTNFYYFIIYVNESNYINILEQIKNNKIKYCRYLLIYDFKDYEIFKYMITKIKILSKKKYYISITPKNNKYNYILNNILYFEKLIIFNDVFDLKVINDSNKILEFYKIYLSKKYIVIPGNLFTELPLFESNKEYILPNIYKMILLNISIFKDEIIYYENKNYFDKYLQLKAFPKNYDIIEYKMNITKDYYNLIKVIDEHSKNINNNNQAIQIILKKITIAILTNTEKTINEVTFNALTYFEDISLLKNIYMMIKFTSFDKIKENILIKLIDKIKSDDKLILYYYSELSKNIGKSSNLIKFYDITLEKKDLILKNFDKIKIINLLFNTIIVNNNFEDKDKLEKLNNLILSIEDNNNNMYSIESQIDLYKKGFIDKNIITYLIIGSSGKFDFFNSSYEEFIIKRNIVKANFEKIQNLFDIKIPLNKILVFPICNFQLSYQGLPSKDIFILKNNLFKQICPELNYKVDTNFKNNKIKVLFHAQHLNRQHSVYKDRHQVIKGLSLDSKFDVYFSTFDELDSEVKFTFGNAKHIKLPTNLENIKNTLASMKLDIIVYCEIGMHPISYYMAHMKLAKIQCNTWGHSDTSGIDSIDYYFSSKLYELPYEEAQTHYSEKLILQNSLCTSYVNPLSRHNPKNFKNRFHFGLTDDAVIYFCAQSLFKINPIYDEYIIKILKNVPNSLIIFLDGDKKPKILERLNNHGIGSQIRFFPGMQHFGYMNLMNVSDIFLDIYPFGGCNSSFEAFSLSKVIVTQPSIMINGRFTTGFYKKMGLEEYVCNTKEEYIDFAIKLGKDKEYRQSIEKRIAEKKDCLFLDQETIQEWKDDLIKIYDDFHNKQSETIISNDENDTKTLEL